MEAKQAMQQFMKQIKESATDSNELIKIIEKMLENPVLINFTEFLELDEIKQLETGEFRCYFNTLKLFSIGTYRLYLENQSELITLTPVMEKKLKLLSILTMATKSKSVPYDDLLAELDFQDVRHLEDLIIEAIYAELIVAKLDQKNRRIEIDSALARDFQPEDLQSMITTLEQWMEVSETTASCVKGLIDKSNAEKAENVKLREAKAAKMSKLIKEMQIDGGPQSLVKDDPQYKEKLERMKEQHRARAGTSKASTSGVTSSWSRDKS